VVDNAKHRNLKIEQHEPHYKQVQALQRVGTCEQLYVLQSY